MTEYHANMELPGPSGTILSQQNDLTLAASSSGNVIIGTPNSLIPKEDVRQDLGKDFLRWVNLYVSNILSTSGTLGRQPNDPFGAEAVFSPAGWAITSAPITINSSDIEINSSSSMFMEGTSTFETEGFVTFLPTSTVRLNTLMDPTLDNGGSIGQTNKRMSVIHASSGIFNIISPQTSGTDIECGGDFNPEITLTYDLGSISKIWENIHSSSIITDTLNPTGTDLAMSGNFIPSVTNQFNLGNASKVWKELWARDIQLTNINSIGAGGITAADNWVFADNVTVEGVTTVEDIQVLNTLDVDGTSQFDGNAQFDGRLDVNANSALRRPTINGSGIALVNEGSPSWDNHYFIVPAITGYVEGFQNTQDVNLGFLPIPIAERCKLKREFSVNAIYAVGTGGEWQFVVQKRTIGSGARVQVASGIFSWGAGAFVPQTTPGYFNGTDADLIFEAGDSYDVIVHNDGSGITQNTPIIRTRIGFTTFQANSGIGV